MPKAYIHPIAWGIALVSLVWGDPFPAKRRAI